jgi:hypothetical protein
MLSYTTLRDLWTGARNGFIEAVHNFKAAGALHKAVCGALAIMLCAILYRESFQIWDWLNEGSDGQIIVNTPTVYTRQRLVNDRLLQSNWLKNQLEAAEGIEPSGFRTIDQVRSQSIDQMIRAGSTIRPTVSNGKATGQPDAVAQQSEAKSRLENLEEGRVLPTTIELFRAKNNFREIVRGEMMQTQLDDRHDIRNNTIHRLSFDTAILAGTRPDSVAAIKVTIRERVINTDYDELYKQWIRETQKILAQSTANVTSVILQRRPEIAKLLLDLPGFLTKRLCKIGVARRLHLGLEEIDKAWPKDEVCSREEELSPYSNLLAAYIQADIEHLERVDQALFAKQLKDSLNDGVGPLPSYRKASEVCQQMPGGKVPLSVFGFLQSDIKTRKLDELRQQYEKVPQGASYPIDCPRPVSVFDKINALVIMYNAVMSGTALEVEQLKLRFLKESCGKVDVKSDDDIQSCTFPSVLGEKIVCFAADLVRAQQQQQLNLRYFMSISVVGRETGDCQLVANQPSINAETLRPVDMDTLRKEFLDKLREGTEVFSYGVNPKTYSQHVSTASEIHEALQLLAVGGSGARESTLEALRERRDSLGAILAHPVVVGFGAPQAPTYDISEAKSMSFGWIVAPQWNANGKPDQIDGEYDLSAVISVPSWWESVDLTIETCWLSRSDLGSLKPETDADLCGRNRSEYRPATIRLPGGAKEVSRKLGIEIVQEPYVNPSGTEQTLQMGKPGSLLLTGGRLWRSTEVTLGSQKADTIVILPNMDGILAQFDCVEPQYEYIGPERQSAGKILAPVRVFTSEGVAEGPSVSLLIPAQRDQFKNNSSVPMGQMRSAQQDQQKTGPPLQSGEPSQGQTPAPSTTSQVSGAKDGAKSINDAQRVTAEQGYDDNSTVCPDPEVRRWHKAQLKGQALSLPQHH